MQPAENPAGLGWVAGASVLTGLAFFFPGLNGPIWTSLLWAMGVVGVFFAGLLAYLIQNSRSTGDLVFGTGILVLLAALALHVALSSRNRAHWKRELLTERFRMEIDRGLMDKHLNTPLLKALKAFHQNQAHQKQARSENLRQLFENRHRDSLKPDSGLTRFIPEGLEVKKFPVLYYDSTRTESESTAENKVVLIGRSGSENGTDPGFVNCDGSKGNMQYEAVLTPRGVTYVREN